MNILIKLTCLIGLVIAPILGNGHGDDKNVGQAGTKMEACCKKDGAKECHKDMKMKCDMSKCAKMTKEECAAKGCTNSSCENTKTAAVGKCDMSKCASMTKDECAAMCDANQQR